MATIIEHPDASTDNLHNAQAYLWEYCWAFRLDPKAFEVDDDLVDAMVATLGDDSFSRKAFLRRVLPALVATGMLERHIIRDSAGKVTGSTYCLPEGDEGWYADTSIPRISLEASAEPVAQDEVFVDRVAATKAYHVEKLSALVSDPALAHRVDLLATAYTRQAEYHAKLLRGQRVSEKDLKHVDRMIESGRKALGLDIDSKAKARASLAKSLETISPGRLLSDYRNEVQRASEAQLEAMRLEEERALEDLQARIDANARNAS